jgi:hypothetical protein
MSEQRGFVGSWRVLATDLQPAECSLGTFCADGSVLTSIPPLFPPVGDSSELMLTSGGHGAWAATGPDTAVVTFVVLAKDLHGNRLPTVTVRVNMQLGADGQSWSGEGTRTLTDADGKIVFTMPAIVQATRIVAEAPEEMLAGTPELAGRRA